MGLNKRLIGPSVEAGDGPSSPLDVVAYSGDGVNNRQITVANNPDLLIVKRRSPATFWMWNYEDSIVKYIQSNSSAGASSYFDYVKSLNDGSFTVGQDGAVNGSGYNYISYSFQGGGSYVSNTNGSISSSVSANVGAGFSIVKYTGNNTNSTVGHGLSAAPELVLYKVTSTTGNWTVYNSTLTDAYYLKLNTTDAQISEIYNIFNGQPDASVLKLGSGGSINGNGNDHIAYCFHSVDGYQKIGSYTGNGGTQSITLGFQPRFVMWKSTNNAEDWYIMDSVRGVNNVLYFNGSFAEGTSTGVSFDSNGFTLTNSFNASARDYIYLAIA